MSGIRRGDAAPGTAAQARAGRAGCAPHRGGWRADTPPLIAAVHGTSDPGGAAAISRLVDQAANLRPEVEISAAFLSNGSPALSDALAQAAGRGRRPIVVPLLLSSGYHVRHDIPRAAAAVDARVARHLGPDPLVVDVLAERVLPLLGEHPGARLVLAAAGSRDPRAAAETGRAAGLLASRLGRPVTSAFVTTAPSLQATLSAPNEGRPTIVATYLLAPGEFERRVRHAAHGLASAPLAPHPLLARLLLDRYDAARGADRARIRTAAA